MVFLFDGIVLGHIHIFLICPVHLNDWDRDHIERLWMKAQVPSKLGDGCNAGTPPVVSQETNAVELGICFALLPDDVCRLLQQRL